MTDEKKRVLYFFLAAVPIAIILVALALPNFIKIKDKAHRPTSEVYSGEDYYGDRGGDESVMQLSSGVDKKSSRATFGEAGSNAGGQSYGSELPDTGRNDPLTRSGKPTSTPRSRSGESMVSRVLAAAGIDEGQLDSWLMPKAYAQDHGVDERYLVRKGECQMEVGDYKDAVTRITAIAEFHGGMVSDSQSQRYAEGHVEGWITIRVPAEKFYDAWQEVLDVGDVEQESVSTDDVSTQYLGYISHLKILTAKQATLEKMLEEALATQRKHGLGEGYSLLLDVQDRLFDVTEEIESTEDRAGALADQITRSTITVRLKELKEIIEQIEEIKEEWDWGFGQTGVDAWKNLRAKGRYFGQGFVWFFITGWTGLVPWVIIFLIGWWVYKRWVRPRLIEQGETADGEEPAAEEPVENDAGEANDE